MKKILFKAGCVICLMFLFNTSFAQLGKCKGKYFGNIVAGSIPGNYTSLWNQVTSENGSKWGSVEGTLDVYNFGNSDLAYNWAKSNNGLFKYHNLIWGGQTPGWVNTAATATITNNIDSYFKAVRDHYAPMGGLKIIDVLNEPINTAMPGNLKAALTAGYQADPANVNDKNNPYGWAIWCFQVARKYFPTATLLVNEYNIEMNWNNCRAPYIALVSAVKNAPNLTDGQKNLIDGVGLQCHGIDNLSAANYKACIDEIWTKTGVSIHITEFDIPANPNEAKQLAAYTSLLPVAWEHPHVAGMTLWGYIQGSTWIPGNGATGPGGTDTGILYPASYAANPLGDRPAMTWLKSYMASQPSLSCCPAPGPFASCATICIPPTAAITPTGATTFCSGGTVTLNAGTGAGYSYVWKNGTATITGATNSSYSVTATGNYNVTITNSGGCSTTSTPTMVTVNALPLATITASGPTSIPQGGSVDLNANTGLGYTYKWFNGTLQVGTGITYKATAAGVYTVEITNSNTCSAVSSGISVTMKANLPPVIAITSPLPNAKITGPVTITVNASDPDGTVTLVEYLDGNTVIGTNATAPYSFLWKNPSFGNHTITARATDNQGAITTSTAILVTSGGIVTGIYPITNTNPLNIHIYPNPSSGALFIDSDIQLSAATVTFTDIVGNVHKLSQTANGLGSRIDLSNLATGTYILNIQTENSTFRKKITVISE
jgi:GH35 family endo-1,4-beta-xylanase